MLVNASEVSLQIITYGPFVARSLISVLLSPTLHCPLPSVFLCLDIQVSFGIWGMFPFCVDFGAQRLRSFHLVDLAPEVCFSPSILLVSSLDQHVARLYWFLGAYNQAKLHMSKQFFLPLCKDRPSLYVMFQRRRGYSLDSNSDKLSSGLHFFFIICVILSKSSCHCHSELNRRMFCLYQGYPTFKGHFTHNKKQYGDTNFVFLKTLSV